MSRFKSCVLVGVGRFVLLTLAATSLLCASPIPNKTAAPATESPPAATRKVIGYALDAEGRPVPGATVCLTRVRSSEDEFDDSVVIAQTLSQSDGGFALTALEADVKKAMADPPAIFEIWIHKAGLALAHRYIFGEADKEPQILSMTKESPATICLRKPDGSPCGNATVTPIYLWQPAGRWSPPVPKLIQEELKTRSKADGRVIVAGLSGRLAIVAIETAGFGQQQVAIPPQRDRPFAVTLRESKRVEGRIVLPIGEKVDLSKVELRISAISAETGPDAKMTRRQEQENAPPPPGTCYARFLVRPDRDGRFSIARFPIFERGGFSFHVPGADEILITNDPDDFSPSMTCLAGGPVKLDIPVRKGRWVTRIVRDARTKRPLAGIDVEIVSSKQSSLDDTSDESGHLRVCLCPGETYQMHCRLPDGYLHVVPGSEDDVVVPPGAEQLELKPIELVPGVAVHGEVLDVAGQHLVGIRVRGTWRAGDPPTGKGQVPEVSRWTTTDAEGHFQFDDLEAGTNVTLVPVRAGIVLADPVQVVADDKRIRLHEKKCDLVALGGRILGTDHKPIARAQIVVEVEQSLDPTRTFRTAVDADGTFQTPPHFPKQLKYRLTVRAILKDVA